MPGADTESIETQEPSEVAAAKQAGKSSIFTVLMFVVSLSTTAIAGQFALEKHELTSTVHGLSEQHEATLDLLEEARAENLDLLDKRLATEKIALKTHEKLEELLGSLKIAESRRKRLEEQFRDGQTELEKATHSNEELKKERSSLAADHQLMLSKVKAFEKKLKALNDQLHDLEQSNQVLKLREEQIKESLVTSKTALEKEKKRSQTAEASLISLQTEFGINWRRRLGLTKPPMVDAQVLKVDQQIPPQIVINAGSQEKIEQDELFYIVKAGQYVGRARVKTVTATYCVAKVESLEYGKVVAQGDQVTTKKPKNADSTKSQETPE